MNKKIIALLVSVAVLGSQETTSANGLRLSGEPPSQSIGGDSDVQTEKEKEDIQKEIAAVKKAQDAQKAAEAKAAADKAKGIPPAKAVD